MYIIQGRKGNLGMKKYIPYPLLFFGLMGLNYYATKMLNIDADLLIQEQIESIGKNMLFVQLMIPFVLFLGGLFFWVKYVHKQSLVSLTTSRSTIDWKRVFFTFFLISTFIILSIGVDYFYNPQDYLFTFKPIPFLILLALALVLVPIQTSFEEYMFRGYLMQGIGLASGNRWVPLFLTSILFGLLHLANPEVEKLGYIIMIYYIGTGLFLGIITLMDEGIELALGFHAANNLITVLLVTSDWTALQTHSILTDVAEPTAGLDILIPVFIVYPLLIFILAKKYDWSDWNVKLFGRIQSKYSLKEES